MTVLLFIALALDWLLRLIGAAFIAAFTIGLFKAKKHINRQVEERLPAVESVKLAISSGECDAAIARALQRNLNRQRSMNS